MVRREDLILTEHILREIKEERKTINEIAEKVGANWDTVERKINLLKSLNIVDSNKKNNREYFGVRYNSIIYNTLFNIPITNEERERTEAIFAAIEKAWLKQSSVKPGKTQMQKTAVKVAKELEIDIPAGWYKWGKLCLLQYDKNKKYVEDETIVRFDNEIIKSTVNEFKSKSAELSVKLQYEQEKEPLYITKYNLEKELISLDEKISNKDKILLLLAMLAANFKEEDNTKFNINELLDYFVGTMQTIFRKLENEIIFSRKGELITAFKDMWNVLATYNFYNTLSSSVDKTIIHSLMFTNIKNCIIISEESIDECREILDSLRVQN